MDNNKSASETAKPESKKMIQMSEEQFNNLMTVVKDLKEDKEKRDKDITTLFAIADKKQLENWNSKHRSFTQQIVKLTVWDNKLVLSWDKMPLDEVGKNTTTGNWYERQTSRIHFEDETTAEVNYLNFATKSVKIEGKVIEEVIKSNENGEYHQLKVDLGAGKIVSIDSTFVN